MNIDHLTLLLLYRGDVIGLDSRSLALTLKLQYTNSLAVNVNVNININIRGVNKYQYFCLVSLISCC